MARTITDIFNDKIQQVANDATLSPLLTSTSKFAVWRLILYISAFCDWSLEKLHDIFKEEVNETIAAMKPHSVRWYAEMAKKFQYGYNLVADSDYYDNSNLTEAQVDASLIISHAAVVEIPNTGVIRIKVAKMVGGALTQLSVGELAAFTIYMQRIKDAGVFIFCSSGNADKLKLVLRIKYNALVLNSLGGRIDGSDNEPVQNAIRNFLNNLPFNGVFATEDMVDAIQAVDGVDKVKVDQIYSKYGALAFTAIDIDYTPDSGYMVIDNPDLNITFIAS